MDTSAIIAIGVFLLALAALWPYLRAGKTKATMDLLRTELAVEHDARVAQEERCNEKIAAQDRRHTGELAEVRGQLSVLTGDFAKKLADELAEVISDRFPKP